MRKPRYTVSQLAELLGVRRQSIQELVQKYKVPYYSLYLGHKKPVHLIRLDQFVQILIRRMKYHGYLYHILRNISL